jgi:hypothetical protein
MADHGTDNIQHHETTRTQHTKHSLESHKTYNMNKKHTEESREILVPILNCEHTETVIHNHLDLASLRKFKIRIKQITIAPKLISFIFTSASYVNVYNFCPFNIYSLYIDTQHEEL